MAVNWLVRIPRFRNKQSLFEVTTKCLEDKRQIVGCYVTYRMQNIQNSIITESSFSYLWPACEKKSSSDISIFLLYYFLKASHTFHSRFHKHLKRWYFLIYATVHLQTWRCCTLLGSECDSFNLIYAIKVYHHVCMDDLESTGWKIRIDLR